MDIVARAAALNHVAGQGEGRAAEPDDRQACTEMGGDLADRIRYVTEIGAAVGTQPCNGLDRAQWLGDHRALACAEVKIKSHDLERQQQIGKDNGGVYSQLFRRGDGDLSRQCRLLADLEQRMLLAHRAVLSHVASRLAHQPDGRCVYGELFAGVHKAGVGGRHNGSGAWCER